MKSHPDLSDQIPGTRFKNSKWIWPHHERNPNGHVLFRTHFDLTGSAQAAWLFIAAESFARVYVNGVEVLRTSSLSYPGQHYYEAVDIAHALFPDQNEVAILVNYIGVPSGASGPKDPGLLAEFVRPDGSVISSSGSDWLARSLDAWSGQFRRSKWLNLDLVEILDFRKLPLDFPMVEINEHFSPSEATGHPGVRFISLEPRTFAKPSGRLIETLEVIEQGVVEDRSEHFEIPALAVHAESIQHKNLGVKNGDSFSLKMTQPGEAWAIIFDLGTYEKGFPHFMIRGDPGAEVDLTWYENVLNPENRNQLAKMHTTDRYILSGGVDIISPEEWKCGRHLQLTFRKIKTHLNVQDLRWEQAHFPLQPKVSLTSSSRQLEKILEIGLRAAALCMHDNIMDCPWRERRQWIGDAQRIGLINYYAFGEFALPRAVLKQHIRLQDISGRIWVCQPIYEEYPSQSMEWLRALLEYQEFSDDQSLIPEVAENIELLHRWFLKCRDSRGLLFITQTPVMNWMDNSYGSTLSQDQPSVRDYQFQTPFLALNLRYLLFLDDVSTSLRLPGFESIADQAAHERQRLAATIQEHFWDADLGLLRDCANPDLPLSISEMGHALAVLTDLPGIDGAQLWDQFQTYAQKHPTKVIPTTPFGKYHTHQALGKLNRPQALLQDILAHWSPMVDAHADTTWERFDGEGSLCHGWAGIPYIAILRHLLKFNPKNPEPKTIQNLANIDWIHAEIPNNN